MKTVQISYSKEFLSGTLFTETYIDETRNARYGESGPHKLERPIGEAYRLWRAEYGRCRSRVYIDGPDGKAIHVGWVFEKCARYEDTGKPYLQSVWISLCTVMPEKRKHVAVSAARDLNPSLASIR